MPRWAGSCWLRDALHGSHERPDRFAGEEDLAYWMGPRDGKASGGTDAMPSAASNAVLLLYAFCRRSS